MKTDHDFRTNGKSQLLSMAFASNVVQYVCTSALSVSALGGVPISRMAPSGIFL